MNLSIDPGHKGGFALFDGPTLRRVGRWTGGFKGYLKMLKELLDEPAGMDVVVELPAPAQRKGWKTWLSQGRYLGATQLFSVFGRHFYHEVHPNTWKAWLRKRTGGDTSKLAAMRESGLSHDGMADAWCIGQWFYEREMA